ncbi:hypothetical protein BLA29_006255 [Euroglyphus maynei]|uniref:Uncharacterized protein n=1 Tax=Euroglyphus maynei TaxID=6958 RepID=A0A1Y3B5A4_EURMA|nr:hypothetical protein BLA29_006255 [Euroglyphus maynei]
MKILTFFPNKKKNHQSYINGEAQPPGYYKQSFLCEPFRIMNSNHTMLSDTIKRNAHWLENLDYLEKRMDRFEQMLENKCRAAINSSKEMIAQHSTYKIFDTAGDVDPLLFPASFRESYQKHCQQKKEKENILIEIESSNSTINGSNNDDGHTVCDELASIDFNPTHNDSIEQTVVMTVNNMDNGNNDLQKLSNSSCPSESICSTTIDSDRNETKE